MNFRIKFGWITTTFWLALWVVFLSYDWDSAKKMAFNEWGDFFAGAFAPLAFLWLVIGYFQQGEELSQNTKALEQQEKALQLQVTELRQSVEQQNRSALALNRQSITAGLMARLDATNHILESLERQKGRISMLDSVGSSTQIKLITEKQKGHEESVEKLLKEIELFEDENNE